MEPVTVGKTSRAFRADQDLTGLGEVGEPGSEIGHEAFGRIHPSSPAQSLEPRRPDGGAVLS